MRVAFASDLHVDTTKELVVDALVQHLKNERADVLCVAGDTAATIEKSLKVFEEIEFRTGVQIAAVPGNHEMWDTREQSSFGALEKFHQKMGKRSVQEEPCEMGDWVILGNMGWYDYSCAPPYLYTKEIEKMAIKGMVWQDRNWCDWGGWSNPEVASFLLRELKEQIHYYREKRIILLSHIVPYGENVQVKHLKEWDYFNSYIGNVNIGQLAEENRVDYIQFGHTHTRHESVSDNGVKRICTPLGYVGEWQGFDVFREVEQAVPVKEIPIDS